MVFGKFNYNAMCACQDLVFQIIKNKTAFVNEENIDQLINLLVDLIKLDLIHFNFYETITIQIVWKVLHELVV